MTDRARAGGHHARPRRGGPLREASAAAQRSPRLGPKAGGATSSPRRGPSRQVRAWEQGEGAANGNVLGGTMAEQGTSRCKMNLKKELSLDWSLCACVLSTLLLQSEVSGSW